jgi:hypothetical protein
MSLENTTLLLAVRIDHGDRLNNLTRCLKYTLSKFSGLKVVLIENGPKQLTGPALRAVEDYADRIDYEFQEEQSSLFHRTKVLNDCLRKSTTRVVSLYDVDVILPLESFIKAERMIVNGTFHMYYHSPTLPAAFTCRRRGEMRCWI